MSKSGPSLEVFGFTFCSAFLVVLIYFQSFKGQLKVEHIPVYASVIALLFVAFKGGYVRHDGHALGPMAALLLLSFLYFLSHKINNLSKLGGLFFMIYLSLLIVFSINTFHHYRKHDYLIHPFTQIKTHMVAAYSTFNDDSFYRSKYEKAMDSITHKNPLPDIPGTFDLYPFNQTLLIAHNLNYSPRPIFQSYKAYTPKLLKLNADHLKTANAPENILFRIKAIDNRFPTLEDSLSWPHFLTQYTAINIVGKYVHLKRKTTDISEHEFIDLGQKSFSFGETVVLPPDKYIWAKLNIQRTFLGRIVEALYKLPLVSLYAQSGTECTYTETPTKAKEYRLINGMSSSGFLLSPIVENNSQFLMLFDNPESLLKQQRACSFIVDLTNNSSLAKRLLFKNINVKLFELKWYH